MSEITLNHWYKHEHSPAYAKVDRINKKTVHMVFDNGFNCTVPQEVFWDNFKETAKSIAMTKGEMK